MEDQTALARRGGSSRSSSRSSSSFGRSSFGGSSRTTRTITRRSTSYRTPRSSWGAAVYLNYATYHPVGWIAGSPYYDNRYGYYYNGVTVYGGVHSQPMNPVVAVIIVVIVCAIIIIAAKNSKGGHYEDDDYHSETIITETVVEENFAPVQFPFGQAMCNAGHMFTQMTTHPYNGEGGLPECDNC